MHFPLIDHKQSTRLHSFAEIAENPQAGRLTLVHHHLSEDGGLEEVIMRVQGYLVDAKLPPIRQME